MPFAGYADFADCVRKNATKDNPRGYCATIQRSVEGPMRETAEPLDAEFAEHPAGVSHSHNPWLGKKTGESPGQKKKAGAAKPKTVTWASLGGRRNSRAYIRNLLSKGVRITGLPLSFREGVLTEADLSASDRRALHLELKFGADPMLPSNLAEHNTPAPHEHSFGRGGKAPDQVMSGGKETKASYEKRMAYKRQKFKALLAKGGSATLAIKGQGDVTVDLKHVEKGVDPMGENIQFTIGNEVYNIHPDYLTKAKKGSTVWWGGRTVREAAASRLEMKVLGDPMLPR